MSPRDAALGGTGPASVLPVGCLQLAHPIQVVKASHPSTRSVAPSGVPISFMARTIALNVKVKGYRIAPSLMLNTNWRGVWIDQ